MTQITASMVKELRDRTQLPMMECKKALTESDGDIEKAQDLLRKSGALAAEKKAGRETAEGRITTSISEDGCIGTIVEVRCETAPVANTDDFVEFCSNVAKHLVSGDRIPDSPELLMDQNLSFDNSKTIKDIYNDVINKLRENMQIRRFARLEGSPVGTYIHHNGQVAVITQLDCDNSLAKDDRIGELIRDLCMHITAIHPMAIERDQIPADLVEREKEIIKAQTEKQTKDKPENIIEKILQGKINKWYNERVLLEQPFVKDDKKTVKQVVDECSKAVGQPIGIKAFLRYEVGGQG